MPDVHVSVMALLDFNKFDFLKLVFTFMNQKKRSKEIEQNLLFLAQDLLQCFENRSRRVQYLEMDNKNSEVRQ